MVIKWIHASDWASYGQLRIWESRNLTSPQYKQDLQTETDIQDDTSRASLSTSKKARNKKQLMKAVIYGRKSAPQGGKKIETQINAL